MPVTIGKADPTATAPTGLTATYGQTLADVTLTNPAGNMAGTWTWANSSTSVGNVGSNTFKANFTPNDTANYNSKSNVDVTVTVYPVHAHDNITFQPWTSTNSLPPRAGNWYLTDNVELGSQWSVPEGMTNLCLNGKTVTFTGTTGRVIYVGLGNTLNLYECSQTSGIITGGEGETYGGGVLVDGTFHMFGGTIKACKADLGGGVFIANRGAFIMDGGVISDNRGKASGDYHYGGGGVGMNNGTFTMNGGHIIRNSAHNGGGIYAIKGDNELETIQITIAGGYISNNEATAYNNSGGAGAAVYANGNVVVNVSGGDINQNRASTCGGIYLTYSKILQFLYHSPIRVFLMSFAKELKQIWLAKDATEGKKTLPSPSPARWGPARTSVCRWRPPACSPPAPTRSRPATT